MAFGQVMDATGIPGYRTRDVDACRDYIMAATGTHRFDIGRNSSLLEFVHQECSVGRVSLHSVNMDCSDGFRITKSKAAPYYSFQFPITGECRLDGAFGSIVARPGDVFVLDPDHITREFWPQKCVQFLVRIDRNLLEQAVAAELGMNLHNHLVFQPVVRDPGIGAWLNHITSAIQTEGAAASVIADRRVSKSFEHTLITMILAGLQHNESENLNRSNQGAAPYYVKRAETYVREHLRDELSVDELAAAAGVSPRSMFYGFKRWRNTTPMSYVRNVRLDVARKQLEKARAAGATVSQVAMDVGFTNFSQFSKIYKARFGETPSATLMGG